MRRGFTLLEVMVACLLLGMLVTVLTMIFNQSSIAWRTGTAGVVNLNGTRRELSRIHDESDAMLPSVAAQGDFRYRIASVWENGTFRGNGNERNFKNASPSFSYTDAQTGKRMSVSSSGTGQDVSLYSVGVRSAGPDGKFETADDITTWPDTIL